MIPFLVMVAGLTVSGVLSYFLIRLIRARMRQKMREAALKDAKKFDGETTIE